MDRANRGRRLPFAAPLRSGHRSRPRPRPELVCDGRGISSENETSWTQRAGPASHGRLATLPEQLLGFALSRRGAKARIQVVAQVELRGDHGLQVLLAE